MACVEGSVSGGVPRFAAAAIMSPHAAAAELPVHDLQIVETRYGFEPRGEPAGDNRRLGFNIFSRFY